MSWYRRLFKTSSGTWLIAGQVFSSISNLLLVVLVGRNASVDQFAAFALIMPLVLLAMRLSRVWLLIPRQLQLNSPRPIDEEQSPIRPSAVVGLSASVLLGVGMCIESVRAWAAVFAAAAFGVVIYDSIRNEWVARRKLAQTCILDASWLVGQCVLHAVVVAANLPVHMHVLAWGLVPLGVSLVGLSSRALNLGEGAGALRYLGSHAQSLRDGLGDLVSGLVTLQVIPYVVLVLLGAPAAGALRGGQSLLGPVNVLSMGLLPLVSMNVAATGTPGWAARRLVLRQAVFLTLVATCYAVPVALVPDVLGTELLGETWAETRLMIPGLVALLIVRAPVPVLMASLRAMGLFAAVRRIRAIFAVLMTLGAALGGILGASWVPWGMAGGAAASAVLALWTVLRETSQTGAFIPIPQGGADA